VAAGQVPGSAADVPAGTGDVRAVSVPGVILTAAAVEKVGALLAKEGRTDLRLRVAVQPGGCSGLRYQLYFDGRLADGDEVMRFGDAGLGRQETGQRGSDQDGGYDSGYESGHDE
jgi:hypothetical protein